MGSEVIDMKKILSGAALAAFIFLPAYAADTLPNSGTYYVVNCGSNVAVEPLAATSGQNVFLKDFNQGGLQKFVLTRKIDPKTKLPTNKYTIKSANEAATLFLKPFPIVDHTAMIDPTPSVFTFKPSAEGIVVESVAQNGDAMYALPAEPFVELRFGPKAEDAKYKWKFVKVED